MRWNLGPKGVRVNAIAPGLIQTVLSEYYWKDEDAFGQMLAAQPIRHLGQPSEIAEMALMLAERRRDLPNRPNHRRGRRPHFSSM